MCSKHAVIIKIPYSKYQLVRLRKQSASFFILSGELHPSLSHISAKLQAEREAAHHLYTATSHNLIYSVISIVCPLLICCLH